MNALPPLSFQVTNLLSSDRTGPWTVDYDDIGLPTHDGNCFTFSPSLTYAYHDYAYVQFSGDGLTTSTCLEEHLDFLSDPENISVEFNDFTLVGIDKINTENQLAGWDVYGQAGDKRIYSNGYIDIFHLGVLKLRLISNMIEIRTPYPNRDQIRALNPVLLSGWQGSIGTGGTISAYGLGVVDTDNSDPLWANAIGDAEGNVKYALSSISYQMQFPPSTARYSYIIDLSPATEAISHQSFATLPLNSFIMPDVNLDMYINAAVLGGALGNMNNISITTIPLPVKVFAYASKYWQIYTTLSSYNVDITFDLTGEDLGPQTNWRVYRRENSGSPWVEWAGAYETLPGNKIKISNVTSFSDWTVGTLVDPTLPVELASFSAVQNAQNYVQLNWVTHSETGLIGYNMYRNSSESSSSAIRINNSIIPPTNTSNTSSYSFTDKEVNVGETYYYWLESVEMDGQNSMYGPVNVSVTGGSVPSLPETSSLGSAYPNPFRLQGSTNIDVAIKAGDEGSVSIYNMKGQILKSYALLAGNHTISWDAKDQNGKTCGSGIYLYRLSSPSLNKSGKLMVIK